MRFLCLLLFVSAAPAWGQMASPTEPGTPAGEPAADLAGLRVARETLTLDLRPLLGDRLAVVEAEYRILNPGGVRVVPLQFLAMGGRVEEAQVWLDEQPVIALRLDSLRVPPSWTIATETPALDAEPVPYTTDASLATARGLTFVVPIPTGQHTVRVRHGVRPGSYDDGRHPNRVWQLAYSLAPARRWAGFGQLDVTVLVPPGWEAAASLPMRAETAADGEGQRLVGRFAGVPGDVLAVSVRAPAPVLRVPFWIAGALAALVVVGFVGFVAGRLVAQSGRRLGAAVPGAVLGGVIAAVLMVVLVSIGADQGDSGAYGYGLVVQMMTVVGPLAIVACAALTLAVAAVTARRWRAEGGG